MAGRDDVGVIDAITQTAEGEVVSIISHDRPWTDGDEELTRLGEKIDNYAFFMLDEGSATSDPAAAEPSRRGSRSTRGFSCGRARGRDTQSTPGSPGHHHECEWRTAAIAVGLLESDRGSLSRVAGHVDSWRMRSSARTPMT